MGRSQDEAMAVASKVKRDYAAALAAREPEIDRGGGRRRGSFYRVRVGPFATQNEGQQAGARLKGSGLDCTVVTRNSLAFPRDRQKCRIIMHFAKGGVAPNGLASPQSHVRMGLV